MRAVGVAPGFLEIFGRTFGILPGQAIHAVNQHDTVEAVAFGNKEIRIHRKFFRIPTSQSRATQESPSLRWRPTLDASFNAAAASFLLVIEMEGVILSALRIYDDLHPRLETRTPLGALEQIVEEIGLELQVGGTRSKLIVGQRVPVPESRAEGLFHRISSRRSQDQWYWTLEPGPPPVAHCALCFSIDIDGYRRYLRREI